MCIALANWMLSMPDAGWYNKIFDSGVSILSPLSILLAVIAILAFLYGRALDSIVFFGAAGLFWSGYHWLQSPMNDSYSYAGWFFCVWAVFFFYVWLASFRAGRLRFFYLLAQWLTLLLFAIADWSGVHVITRIGGYLGLITAILAVITSAIAVMHGLENGGATYTETTTVTINPEP